MSGGCQADPTAHNWLYPYTSRVSVQCSGGYCGAVQCEVGTQDLLSLPAPSLSEGSRAQIGATGGARGELAKTFLSSSDLFHTSSFLFFRYVTYSLIETDGGFK